VTYVVESISKLPLYSTGFLNELILYFDEKNTILGLYVLTRQNIVHIDGHVGVAIWTHVLVPKSGGVHKLVCDDSGRPTYDTSVVETYFLDATVQQPNVAPATSFPQF
jgi:hypothetical protein